MPRKRKSDLSKKSRMARWLALKRARETPEEREMRLEDCRIRMAIRQSSICACHRALLNGPELYTKWLKEELLADSVRQSNEQLSDYLLQKENRLLRYYARQENEQAFHHLLQKENRLSTYQPRPTDFSAKSNGDRRSYKKCVRVSTHGVNEETSLELYNSALNYSLLSQLATKSTRSTNVFSQDIKEEPSSELYSSVLNYSSALEPASKQTRSTSVFPHNIKKESSSELYKSAVNYSCKSAPAFKPTGSVDKDTKDKVVYLSSIDILVSTGENDYSGAHAATVIKQELCGDNNYQQNVCDVQNVNSYFPICELLEESTELITPD